MNIQKRNQDKQNTRNSTELEFDSGKEDTFIALKEQRAKINVATQERRFEIIQNIVAHPQQLPTLREFDYFIPDVQKSTIRNHLEKLKNTGIVQQIELPNDERKRDNPYVFYGLSAEGRELLEKADLLRAEQSLQEVTLQTQLTPDVEQYMKAPRPDWGPAEPIKADLAE